MTRLYQDLVQLPGGESCRLLSVAHIFLSYVREDRLLVDRLAARLSQAGFELWLDSGQLKPGQQWPSEIRKAIEEAAFFIACFSEAHQARSRSYTNEELTLAIEELRLRPAGRTWLIPVEFSKDSVPERSIRAGESLRDIHRVDLHTDWEEGVRRLLEVIKPPPVSPKAGVFQDPFLAGPIDYAQTRAASLFYLRSAFEDARRARLDLGQRINVLEGRGRHVVERRQALAALDSWWTGWPEDPRPFVLLGEEGMGKTWALSSWLARRLAAEGPTLPLTLFLPSQTVGSSSALPLMASALFTCTGARDKRFWAQRAEEFAQIAPAAHPILLLVLDGLNEQPLFDWQAVLESLRTSPWENRVGLLLTSRPAYWSEAFDSEFRSTVRFFEIGPYDDSELASALEKAGGFQATHLSRDVQLLLRRPRYLDLIVRYWEALERSGDVTVDRLLVEDWKDRMSRKRGLFSDEEFRIFLVQLAESHRGRLLSKEEIRSLLPEGDDFLTSLDEVVTGGIFERDSLGRYAVEPRRLILGLGLHLADQVKGVADQGELAMREVVASFLEPEAGMDQKVAICRLAATFSIFEPDFPEAARAVLFEHWIGSRNFSREDIESFMAYLPAASTTYLHLVERFWTSRRTNHQAQSLLGRAFFRWRDNAQVQQALVKECEKWLSFVHPLGFRFMRGQDESSRAKLRQEIEERAGRPLKRGDKFLLVDELEVIEDDFSLWLAEPALLLSSFYPAVAFVPALRRWALSRSVMGYPEEVEVVAWVLRHGGDDLWPSLAVAIDPLFDGPVVAQQAAWQLLWASGREEAAPHLERLPKDLFPPSFYEEMYTEDPCRMHWRREDCAMCAARPDLTDLDIALKLAPHVLDPDFEIGVDIRPRLLGAISGITGEKLMAGSETTLEDLNLDRIEPTVAALTPDLFAESWRSLVRSLPRRPEKSRPFLLFKLGALTLLLDGPEEQGILKTEWERVRALDWNDEVHHAESGLFAAIFFHLPAQDQLDLLLSRPEKATDEANLGPLFKAMPAESLRRLAQSLLDSPSRELQRKLWFLSYQSAEPVIEVLGAPSLVDLLQHSDSAVRRLARVWLFLHGPDEVFDLAIERNLVTPSTTTLMHRLWGPGFAIRLRSRLPYKKLLHAFDLGSLSYLIRHRPQDLGSYARDLDRAIRLVTSPRNEFKTGFCEQTLSAFVQGYPEMVEGWVQLAVGQDDSRSYVAEYFNMLFEPLAEALLEIDPAQGMLLFRKLLAQRRHARTVDDPTGVDVLALSLFKAPSQSEAVEALLRDWLDGCRSDKDLFELAVAASAAHKETRLRELIRRGLASPFLMGKAVAISLAGFAVHDVQSATLLDSIQFHPEGWLHEVTTWARRHLDRDRRAQEWFRRFAVLPSNEESFAAFRLFLRCVDRRYWTWKNHVLDDTRSSWERRRYLAVDGEGEIARAIKENEKDLEKRFLGSEIPENKVHPWVKRYLG